MKVVVQNSQACQLSPQTKLCLSPLLFSLYINNVVEMLKRNDCGLQCGSDTIPALLFADNTAHVAPDEAGLRRSLDCMVEWCDVWG